MIVIGGLITGAVLIATLVWIFGWKIGLLIYGGMVLLATGAMVIDGLMMWLAHKTGRAR